VRLTCDVTAEIPLLVADARLPPAVAVEVDKDEERSRVRGEVERA
jgi:hypothetical protein